MTTTEQLREYLDAHGVDGAPTELGWYVVECDDLDLVIVLVERVLYGLAIRCGGEGGAGLFRSQCERHAPLAIAPTADRGIAAEVARLQSEVDALRAIIESGARGREPCEVCGA